MSRRKPLAAAPARATLTPPPATGPLAERILATIANASSKLPANADDVAALVGGPEAEFWHAFEQLKRDHRVNVAIIRRAADPKEWLAIWPTGLPVKHETWLDAQAPEPSPEPSPERMQFALWDDGGLSIYDGDDLLQIRPADVARLARLLGVPGCQLAGEEAV